MRRLYLAIAALASTLLLSAPGSATTIEATGLGEFVEHADEIVRGVVVASEAVMLDGRVFTRTTIAPETCYVGAPVETVEVLTPGGQIGHLRTVVSGVEAYEVGEQVLVVLERVTLSDATPVYVSAGLGLTKFSLVDTVDGVEAVRHFDGLTQLELSGVVPPDVVRNVFSLAEIEALINARVSR